MSDLKPRHYPVASTARHPRRLSGSRMSHQPSTVIHAHLLATRKCSGGPWPTVVVERCSAAPALLVAAIMGSGIREMDSSVDGVRRLPPHMRGAFQRRPTSQRILPVYFQGGR